MQSRKLIVLVCVCAAALAAAVVPGGKSALRHRASVSDDLAAYQAAHSTGTVRVIAHGGDADLPAAAARVTVFALSESSTTGPSSRRTRRRLNRCGVSRPLSTCPETSPSAIS